jgi:PAS domain S-box-containing protein
MLKKSSSTAKVIPSRLPALMLESMVLDLLPAAVYLCDAAGVVVRYNRRAAELWGRSPNPGDPAELFCGAHRLFWPDGRPLPHEDTPMAAAIRTGRSHHNLEVQIEQPGGRRLWVLVNIDPIRDETGAITGAINCLQDITARKEADERLRESQALLSAVYDTTPECIKIVAADGKLLHMNAAGLRMVEADAAGDVQGGCIFDLIAPEDCERWRSHHERVCNGERLSWQFDIIGQRGTRRHMETHASPLRMPDGTVAQLAITRDVTQRAEHEASLRESERRSRELLDALPTAVYTTDAEGRVTFFNRAAVELSGRQPEIGSDRWSVTWRLYRPDGSPLPHDECPMAMALKENRAVRGAEAIAERPDGTRVPYLAYPTPLRDSAGAVVGAVNVLVDLSDRKRAEESANKLASIVEFSDDAIVSKDLKGIISSWNKAAERLFGYTAAEVIGKPVSILIPDNRQNEEPEILERIGRGERIDHYETVRRRKDGTLIDISLTVSPVRDHTGKISGASKIARDISERKKSEGRRRFLINELNHRVKNTLATVQSIAAQTFRGESQTQAAKWFEGRLIALSQAHDVLTRENWEGADLHDIITEVIAPLCVHADDRFEIEGSKLRLTPKMALALAMGLHELCTNAAKYGALANGTGRVRVAWAVADSADGRQLRLRWSESGGPPVEPPRQSGFGSRLIERSLARELGALVCLRYPVTGAVCDIEALLPSP